MSYPQPYFPPCSARAAGKWLWITPTQEVTGEESEHPPLTSCSKRTPFEEQKKRTIHLLQNRTFLFTLDTRKHFIDTTISINYHSHAAKEAIF